MGWWGTVKKWTSTVVTNVPLSQVVKSVGNFIFNTVQYLFEELSVIPKVVYTMVFRPLTRMLTGHELRITVEDLLPILVFTQIDNSIQNLSDDYLENHPEAAFPGADLAFKMTVNALHLGIWIYLLRKEMQMKVRTLMVTLESGTALNEGNFNVMNVCEEEGCTALRFIKGNVRDLIAFIATDFAISGIGYLPWIGERLKTGLLVLHYGRYALTMVLPQLCNRHQMVYLAEHPELVLALGLTHAALSALVMNGLNFLPAGNLADESVINKFMLTATIAIASQMRLPQPTRRSSRNLDPVGTFQTVVGFLVDNNAAGFKKTIPELLKLLKKDSPGLPWRKVVSVGGKIWLHPAVQLVSQFLKYLLLPRMLQSEERFINDPIIAPNWDGVRNTLILYIQKIEKIQRKYLVRMATCKPEEAAVALWLLLGTPKSLNKLLIEVIGSDGFNVYAGKIRRKLEGMRPGVAPPISVNAKRLALLKESDTLTEVPIELPPEGALSPEEVLRPNKLNPTLSPAMVINLQKRAKSESPDVLENDAVTPQEVIRPSCHVEIDPASVIRRKSSAPTKRVVEDVLLGKNRNVLFTAQAKVHAASQCEVSANDVIEESQRKGHAP